MTDPATPDDGVLDETDPPRIPGGLDVEEPVLRRAGGEIAPEEAFQRLASDVRLAVLVGLLRAERDEDGPLSFSDLQATTGSDSSAGFAYHLRQLSGHFVRKEADGYVLTPAGRRAAIAVVSGAFTERGDRRAS